MIALTPDQINLTVDKNQSVQNLQNQITLCLNTYASQVETNNSKFTTDEFNIAKLQ